MKKTTEIYPAGKFVSRESPIRITRWRHTSTEFPRGNTVLHQREFWKIVYIISGECVYKINGRDCRATAGFLYLSHPEDLTTLEVDDQVELYNVLFRKDFIAADLSRLYGACNFFSVFDREFHPQPASRPDLPHIMDANRKIHSLLKNMEFEWRHEDANSLEMLRLLLLATLIEFARLAEKRRGQRNAIELAAFVDRYLAAHFHEKIGIGTLTTATGVSRSRLLAVYKKATGTTIGSKLLKLRLTEFKRRLASESGALEQLGRECGFPDLCNLYKVFRRETGLPPGKYRAQLCKSPDKTGR